MGLLRLGTYIKFIPFPVTVGFTAGIAVIILASQLRDLMGLTLPGPEPGELIPKLHALAAALPSATPAAIALAVGTIVISAGLKRVRPHWPGLLIAVAAASVAAWALHLPVETIETHFGGIPQALPMPHLPEITLERMEAVLPDALAFSLLGAIESLLSAVVADGMTGRRHRSNCELVAQGVANVMSALFGGICVTGTIARTATNVRAGARGPISGILHSMALLAFILLAAPLAGYIPLAALAGVLATVAWGMADKRDFALLLKMKGEAIVLLATFLLTIFRDLTSGIVVGVSLGALLFIRRMASVTAVERHIPPVTEDRADGAAARRTPFDAALAANPNVVVYRISGAFFFGTAATVGTVLDRIADQYRTLVIDFSAVPFLDSTAARTIAGLARKTHRAGVALMVTGATPAVRHELLTHGVGAPMAHFHASIDAALSALEAASATTVNT
jgi:SulP family sulfate permease